VTPADQAVTLRLVATPKNPALGDAAIRDVAMGSSPECAHAVLEKLVEAYHENLRAPFLFDLDQSDLSQIDDDKWFQADVSPTAIPKYLRQPYWRLLFASLDAEGALAFGSTWDRSWSQVTVILNDLLGAVGDVRAVVEEFLAEAPKEAKKNV
jgi:hypothetical protein